MNARATAIGRSAGHSWPLRAGAVALAALMAVGGAALWLRAGRTMAGDGGSELTKLAHASAVIARAHIRSRRMGGCGP